MREESHYEVLGVTATASAEEIKRRFRELARRQHPDVNADKSASHRAFVRIMEAYRVLGDPHRRAAYDLALRADAATRRPPSPRADTREVATEGRGEERRATGNERPTSGVRHPGTAAGARVEVDFGGTVLVCRLVGTYGRTVHLAAPAGVRYSYPLRERLPVTLTLCQPGICLEAEARVQEWVWRRPPVLVVGPVEGWRERKRRRARRAERQLEARVAIDGIGELPARTENVSATGVSLMVAAAVTIPEGSLAWLRLQIEDDVWCDGMPIRVIRVRIWLRPSGRAVELGAELHEPSENQRLLWQSCLARLGVEE